MKKKEILIIFVLALLVTGLSWLIEWRSITCAVVTCIGINTFCHGFPLTFAINYQLSPRYALTEIGSCAGLPGHVRWFPLSIVLNFLFWFLVLAMLWIMVKWIKRKI